jgi:hypothetical protein
LKYIEADQLPVFLGGKAVNGFGSDSCDPPVRQGGKVPKDFKEVYEDIAEE